MKIWLINHYAVPPQYYPLARPSLFAKNLIKMGHEVTIIAASTVHNSDINLITGKEQVKKEVVDGIPYVYIKCSGYSGNGIRRIINILQFARKLPRVCATLEKPDVIMATSFDPISCYQGIRYAKKKGIKSIAEIADLWPETLVSYGAAKENNPVVKLLRHIERSIYLNADAIIFTMEGAYNYIREQQWEKDIPESKVYYINNGIDLNQFDYNKETFVTQDPDLLNPNLLKVVYTGSIRRVNKLSLLVDAAKLIKKPEIKILIWGDGDELESLKKRIKEEEIPNIVFKGWTEKKCIPYITSMADLNIVHGDDSPVLRFGLSMNKIFDYFAAGKPILVDFHSAFNPIVECGAGFETKDNTAEEIARGIEDFFTLSDFVRSRLGVAARTGAEKYDFENLTNKLVHIIEVITK